MSEETVKPVMPGIFTDMVSHLSGKAQNYILEIDGNKINKGRGKNMGDIDLWGWESQPTLLEKKEKIDDDISLVTDLFLDHTLENTKNFETHFTSVLFVSSEHL